MLDVSRIREDFPVLAKKVYDGMPLVWLDSAATTQKPRQVIQALVDYYEGYNANVHRGVHALSMESTQKYEEARQKVADFVNAESADCLIWTRNTTEGINLVARSWAEDNIRAGDEIVVTALEHHSNLVPWQQVAARKDAKVRVLPLADDQTLDMAAADEIIGARTRLLAVSHASNAVGTINPVRELAAKARAVGAAVLVTALKACRICRWTCGTWTAIFWRSQVTKCLGLRASAGCTSSGIRWSGCGRS